ncbi:TonB-dependent receptor [Maribacter sp. 2307ULW6-5]|uniref:TonB-dependent receptor n=1 Tax=Maribacter sp. 2307ULW6-5 TaxID=3386275 RepID=UPI0039BC6D70
MKKPVDTTWLEEPRFKFSLKMKLTTLFLLTTMLGLHANDSYSQTAKVSLDLENVTVRQVIDEIQSSTKFKFVYKTRDVDLERTVSLKVDKQNIETVLEKLFSKTATIYKVRNTQIILTRDKDAFIDFKRSAVFDKSAQQQGIQITGTVTDENGAPLPGANVIEKGTSNGVVTDFDGSYSITLRNVPAILAFSYVGYKTQEISVQESATRNVSLLPDAQQLEDVVVIGYGSSIKKAVTSSISSVKAEELVEVPVASFDQALQGRAAGVQVTKNTGSPGGGVSIRIRGTTGLLSGQEPLYVVDGVPIINDPAGQFDPFRRSDADGGRGAAGNETVSPIADIAIENIESIEILKDASAASIYGSRAANGVILVTTKRGRVGKPQISFSHYTGVTFIPEKNRYKVLDAEQFAAMTNEGLAQIGQAPFYIESPENNTNWQDKIFRQGLMTDVNLRVSGGSENLAYSVSAAYFDQQGTIINSDFDRFSFRTNLDWTFSDKIKVGTRAVFSKSNSNRLRNNGNDTNDFGNGNSLFGPSVIGSALVANPTYTVKNELGSFTIDPLNNVVNPVGLALTQNLENTANRFLGNVFADIMVVNGLKLHTSFGVDLRDQFDDYFYPPDPAIARSGRLINAASKTFFWLTENYLTYEFPFLGENHNLNLLGGFSFQENNSRGFTVVVSELAAPVASISAGVYAGHNALPFNDFALASTYSRLSYNFKEKYLLQLAGRYDGSSRFGPDNRWGFFPSASAGWLISEENFLKDNDIVSLLKLRAGYGEVGNDQLGNPFEWKGTVSPQGGQTYLLQGTLAPDNIDNRNFSWETTKEYNFGLDASFFNNRLEITADYYRKKTEDLLSSLQLPSTSGFLSRTGNIGDIENKGLELGFIARLFEGKDFRWNMNFNISYNQNKILRLANNGEDIVAGTYSIAREGQPISFRAVRTDGINPETGDFNYLNVTDIDINENGVLDEDEIGVIDINDAVISGSPLPDHFGGFANNLYYKNFDLGIFWQWSYGNDIVNNTLAILENTGLGDRDQVTGNILEEAYLGRWRGPGDTNATYQGIDFNNNYVGGVPVDRYIEDGSYLRLKTLTLGYSLPKTALEKLKIKSLRFYATANNVLTFTNYSGYDPEVNHNNISRGILQGYDNGTYPAGATIIFGLNLNF